VRSRKPRGSARYYEKRPDLYADIGKRLHLEVRGGAEDGARNRNGSGGGAERGVLKEAGAEGLFELLNRNVDQPYKYVGTWLIDEWSKIGLNATQRVVPTGPWFEAMRSGTSQLRGCGQSYDGHPEIPATLGLYRELRDV
jgi:hypothetical protein